MTATGKTAGWLAGFGKADITPPAGYPMSGFVARQEPAEGTHDHLYARCLALSDHQAQAALIVLDVIGTDQELTATIRQAAALATGLNPEAIAVTATHTHGGPTVLREALLGRPSEAYLEELTRKAAEAAAQAVKNQQPAVLRYGEGHNSTVAHNRREQGGIIDPSVPVLRIETPNGKLLGLLTSYGCHPVTLGPNNQLWTADYPGELIQALELLEPEAVVIFATGCCGQINVGHSAADSVTGRGLDRRTFAEARRLGRVLAGEVLAASENVASPGGKAILEPSPRLRMQRQPLELPLRPPETPEALQQRVATWKASLEELRVREPSSGTIHFIQANLEWSETVATQARDSVAAEVMLLSIGELHLAIYPGEVFVEYGLELKQRFASQHIITLGFGNAAPGYIPHGKAFAQGGYEVEDAHRFYGLPAPIAPEAGELILDTMTTLVRQAL